MANPIENLSPEEKLLRVIQGGKKVKAGPESPPPAVAPAAPVVAVSPTAPVAPVTPPESRPVPNRPPVVPEPSADKPKLKVAKGVEVVTPPPVAAAGAKGETKLDTKTQGTEAKAPKGSGAVARPRTADAGGDDFSVRTVNIVLAVSVLIVLFMTGHEIWANVRVQGGDLHVGAVSLPPLGLTEGDAEAAAPLDDVLDAIDQRLLFAVVTQGAAVTPEVQAPRPSEYCSLLGISGDPDGKTEAIIMDKNLKKMLFLKVGDVIAGDNQTWTVQDVQGDQVIFRNGNKECVVR